jgi:hypothetical protein
VRLKRRIIGAGLALGFALAWTAMLVSAAGAQDTVVMMPEQSAAKAKAVIAQSIAAMGGPAYLNVHDVTYEGRLSQFGHSGELNGFEKFLDFEVPPEKDRQENLPKRNLIEVFNGKEGWLLDRGGVQEEGAEAIARFQEDQKKDIDNILRHRILEKDMSFHYAGPDVVDMKEVEWVELTDSDDRTIRIAFAKGTHLPVRKIVTVRDARTRLRTEELEYYSNYHPIQGVTTPFQITREKNDIKVYQVFFDKISFNTNPAPEMFTKQSLDERWQKVGKSEIKKEERQKARDNCKN